MTKNVSCLGVAGDIYGVKGLRNLHHHKGLSARIFEYFMINICFSKKAQFQRSPAEFRSCSLLFVLRAAAPARQNFKCLNLSWMLVPILLILSAIWLKEHLHCHFRYSKIRKEGKKVWDSSKVCIYFWEMETLFFPFILLSFRVWLCGDVLRGRGNWIFSLLWVRQGSK